LLAKISPEENALAQQYFKQAIDTDPNFAGGYKGLAWAHMHAAGVLAIRTLPEGHSLAEELARHAVAADPADAEARSTLSEALLWSIACTSRWRGACTRWRRG
jgi:adenylate cyclase